MAMIAMTTRSSTSVKATRRDGEDMTVPPNEVEPAPVYHVSVTIATENCSLRSANDGIRARILLTRSDCRLDSVLQFPTSPYEFQAACRSGQESTAARHFSDRLVAIVRVIASIARLMSAAQKANVSASNALPKRTQGGTFTATAIAASPANPPRVSPDSESFRDVCDSCMRSTCSGRMSSISRLSASRPTRIMIVARYRGPHVSSILASPNPGSAIAQNRPTLLRLRRPSLGRNPGRPGDARRLQLGPGVSSTDWFDATNWSLVSGTDSGGVAGVPDTAGDSAVFGDPGSGIVNVNVSASRHHRQHFVRSPTREAPYTLGGSLISLAVGSRPPAASVTQSGMISNTISDPLTLAARARRPRRPSTSSPAPR